MGIGSGTAALIGGLVGAGGSIASGAMGASAASGAASDQANAANNAAQLQYQESQNALGFQEQQYNQNQANLQPWLQSGRSGLSQLDYMLGLGSPSGYGGSPAPSSGAINADHPLVGSTLTGGNPSAMSMPIASPVMGNSGLHGLNGGFGSSTYGNPVASPVMGGSGINGIRPMAASGGANIPASGAVPAGGVNIPQSGGFPQSGAVPASPVNTGLGGFGSLMQSYPGGQFQAPTGLTEQNDPGYQARLQLGQDTLERSAAARGGVLTGGTAQAENQAAQDYASNEYSNVYNRALSNYDTNYNVGNTNQTNQYNRLASLAGLGQQTASQLGYLGNQSAQGVASNLLTTGANIGQQYNNAGAANASGLVGSANAWGGALGGATSNLSNLLMLQQLGGMGSGTSSSYGDNGGY